jgi:hypothetical protein
MKAPIRPRNPLVAAAKFRKAQRRNETVKLCKMLGTDSGKSLDSNPVHTFFSVRNVRPGLEFSLGSGWCSARMQRGAGPR